MSLSALFSNGTRPDRMLWLMHDSDIELPESAFVSAPRRARQNRKARIVFVGSLAQLYKAPDVLIDAFATCQPHIDAELVIVGSGRYQHELEERAKDHRIGGCVHFCGQLTNPVDVRSELDRADLFVLPSRVEGLPRAMIEAMARALPCIGSSVGGIPEIHRRPKTSCRLAIFRHSPLKSHRCCSSRCECSKCQRGMSSRQVNTGTRF